MKKNKNTLLNYINKKKYLLFIKNQLYVLKCFNKNLDIEILNSLIINQNNRINTDIKIFNILNFIKNDKKSSKSYKLFIKFKNSWLKINKHFILNKYIDIDTIFIWLAYVLNELLYFNLKEKSFNYKLKENNLYIKLANVIKLNIDNILNKSSVKMTKSLLNKINNNKIYYIIANRIIKTCLNARILYKKTKYIYKKNVNYIILNKTIFKKIVSVIVSQSIQLPTLKPIKYNNEDDININKNFNYTFKFSSNYIEALNYINCQDIIINQDYFNFLCNLKSNELFKLSKFKINLNILKKKGNSIKFLNKKMLTFIFLSNMYIINKYKKYTFYFQYKSDKRGRLYQVNWPMNSLYNKMLSPLFIFKKYDQDQNYNLIKPNFDTYYWYKSYTLNKQKVLSLRDATNSIFQISGCLLLDEKMLKYSNIHNENIRYSIYDFLLNIYLENINNLINEIIKIYNINYFYLLKIKNIDRKFLKKSIMTWCYNESYKSSVKNIYSYIFLDNNKKWYIKIDGLSHKEIKDIYWKVSQCIYKYIFDTFKINFQPYIKLKKFFNLIATHLSVKNKNIKIKHKKNDTHYFEQHHFHKIFKKIYIETLWKIQKVIYINEINESKLSIKDNKRSLAPNIIQYLDSIIAIEVILECKKQSIPIITNHDCFYTTLKHDYNICKIYNCVLYFLFIEHNFIEDLLIENNLLDDLKIQSIYKSINNIRNKNIKKIKNIFDNDIKYSISINAKEYVNDIMPE